MSDLSPEADPAPEAAPEAPSTAEGVVARSTGSWYDVLLPDGERIQARARGKFRLIAEEIDETNPVAVGDHVEIRLEDDGTALITDIRPRTTKLSRRAAGRRHSREHVLVANVDAAWCVQSVFAPKFNSGFVDRVLVMAEAYGVEAGVVINKADLMVGHKKAEEAIGFWISLYESLGYPVLLTSAELGIGVDEFRDALTDRTSVVAGPSGVGKSSLLNAVDPALDLRTGEVSQKTQKGKHTTTFYTLYPLAAGGYVVDTPGIREFGLWDMTPPELGGYFVEMRPLIQDCRFPNCTHDHEPGCAVTAAVDEGTVTLERYGSYLNILASLRSGEDRGR
ncbi:MAG: ribosome small subunit-dependent GTPase A [Bacteroidota bacterium]